MTQIDVVLPVHNEAGSIRATLEEFHSVVASEEIAIRFVICEDGSTDRTVEVLKALQEELPIHLITGPERKGYSRAAIDGLRATTAPLVCFIDSDGQCDPRDFKRFHDAIEGCDMVVGYRNPRQDHWIRKLMSRSFKALFSLLFEVPLRDPSCPYLLIKQEKLQDVLQGNLGILTQGFWWEFMARAFAAGLRIQQVPVNHRVRSAGETQIYNTRKVPRIAAEHIAGLFKLRRELKSRSRAQQERTI